MVWIRDYYAYGFKSYDQFSKGSQTINNRWKVFSKVLGEKWLTNQWFRLGTSRLANMLLSEIEGREVKFF